MNFIKKLKTRFINIYPPLVGAGIKITYSSPDRLTFKVRMKLRWWNKNLVGVHYGGSLYSMCDPFYMMILLEKIGNEFIVWDKAATIRFKKPGKKTVFGTFHIPEEKIIQIREEVQKEGKKDFNFTVHVIDEDGDVVAEVDKLVYVKKKENS
jgi:hypothetical protein